MAKKNGKRMKRRVSLGKFGAGMHYATKTGYSGAANQLMNGNWSAAIATIGAGHEPGNVVRASVPAIFVKFVGNAIGPLPFYSSRTKQYTIF